VLCVESANSLSERLCFHALIFRLVLEIVMWRLPQAQRRSELVLLVGVDQAEGRGVFTASVGAACYIEIVILVELHVLVGFAASLL